MSIDQLLNKAREKGLGDFRSDYGYDENCGKHKELLANAKKELLKTLKTNAAPDYDDPFIVDAYLGDYHLQHCRLAFWVFNYFFNRLGVVPNALYVCDVGAGTQAGCIGLASALRKYKEKPAVYFDAYEPSDEMWNAGYCVWSAFRDSVGANFDPDPWSALPHRLPDNLPANALRIVTAFHLSLPYNNNRWDENDIGKKALDSLEKAFCLVSPEYGLFTCHKDKEDSLNQAVDSSYVWNEEKGSKPYVSDSIKPYPPWNLPKDSILLLREAAARHKADKQG